MCSGRRGGGGGGHSGRSGRRLLGHLGLGGGKPLVAQVSSGPYGSPASSDCTHCRQAMCLIRSKKIVPRCSSSKHRKPAPAGCPPTCAGAVVVAGAAVGPPIAPGTGAHSCGMDRQRPKFNQRQLRHAWRVCRALGMGCGTRMRLAVYSCLHTNHQTQRPSSQRGAGPAERSACAPAARKRGMLCCLLVSAAG